MTKKSLNRQRQRRRIARALKDLRRIKEDSKNKRDALLSLRILASNYKKIQ